MTSSDIATTPLWACETEQQVLGWLRDRLERGFTLTDPYIFGNAGLSVDPQRLIARLRDTGMNIQTCYRCLRDAAGIEHTRVLAWKKGD